MARAENNNKNAVTNSNENNNSGKLKIIIAILVVTVIIAASVAVIVGSLKKNPSAESDPFIAVAKESKEVSEKDPAVEALSAVHKTVFGTNSLELHGAIRENNIDLIAQYGKDLLSSSVYFSFGKQKEALLFDGQYFQYDGGDALTVAYPAPLLSDSKNIVAALRGDFISIFPDLSTTPEFYNVVGSDINGSIQTAATAISGKYLDFYSISELFNSNKTVMAQFFFGTDYKGTVPDFDVLYKSAADFILNGLSEKSLKVTVSGNGKVLTYAINGNMVSATEELITYLTDNKTAKLLLGNDFYEKLMTNLNAYVKANEAKRASADFSGTIVTEKGFVSQIQITGADASIINLSTKNINKAKVSSSFYDEINSRADKKTIIKDKDSLLNYFRGKVRV